PALPLGEPMAPWFGIQSISAGVFGVPIGFAVIVLVSLVTRAPPQETQDFVAGVRFPQEDDESPKGAEQRS
ncbi:MAG TPA: hypothetical protein PKD04_09100, partial [Rhodocyclaceae bacterium]|nr:hypothetical protein [Rhodocyclaceae bacterium]